MSPYRCLYLGFERLAFGLICRLKRLDLGLAFGLQADLRLLIGLLQADLRMHRALQVGQRQPGIACRQAGRQAGRRFLAGTSTEGGRSGTRADLRMHRGA